MARICCVALILLLLAGCATRPEWLRNRIACTPDGGELHALSVWGPFSVGSAIDPRDAEAVCRRSP
jgi:hypothetical protein